MVIYMLDNSFTMRYKNVPAAIYLKNDFEETLLHNHNELEILIIEKGRAVVRINKNEYHCQSGDLIFVNPLEVHSIIVDKAVPYRQKCICFDASLISNNKISKKIQNEVLGFPHHIPQDSPHCNQLRQYAISAFEAVEQNAPEVYMEVSAYITLVVAYMQNNRLTTERHIKTDSFYSDILNYISAHFSDVITSADAAQAMNYTHSYFCRRFRVGFGMSFSQYLNSFRIMRAKQIMEQDEKSSRKLPLTAAFSIILIFQSALRQLSAFRRLNIKKSQYNTKFLSILTQHSL